MTYLVTGGTGMIGSRIVRNLARQGEQVIAFDLFPESSYLPNMLTDDERNRVKVVRGDVNDLAGFIRLTKESKAQCIIHMASLLAETATANPLLALKVMSEGTLNVFETARILELRKVVWASSITVLGTPEQYGLETIPNDALFSPQGPYGACKALNEVMAAHYFEQYSVDISAIRYSVVYGPCRAGGSSFVVTRELIENPALGKPGRVPFGDAIENWLYVEDAAKATVLAAKAVRQKTRAYNISGDIRPVREVADYVRKLVPGADITLLPGKRVRSWKFDTSPIENELGFRPEWPLERGVKEMIDITRRQSGLPPAG